MPDQPADTGVASQADAEGIQATADQADIAAAVDEQSGAELLDGAFPADGTASDEATPAAPAEGQPPVTPSLTPVDYLAMVTADPRRASEVPEDQREVLLPQAQMLRQQLYEQALADIAHELEQVSTQQQQVASQTATLRELWNSGDKEAFDAEAARDPAAAREFHAAMAGVAPPPPPPQISPEQRQLASDAQVLFRTVKDDAARQQLVANNEARKYPPTPEGYAALEADVAAVLSGDDITGAAYSPTRMRTPEERAATNRARAQLARAEVAPGTVDPADRVSAREIEESSGSQLLDKAFGARGAA